MLLYKKGAIDLIEVYLFSLFWLALSGQTTDIVALATVQQSPLLYFCIAFFPRLLCGLLSGLVCRGMKRICRGKGTLAYAVTGAVGSLCNTVLYLGALYLLIRGKRQKITVIAL